jgi:hypothetical protein
MVGADRHEEALLAEVVETLESFEFMIGKSSISITCMITSL